MSTWECLLYALVCFLGSHTLEWPIGGVFIALHTKLTVGEKLLLSAAHRTVRWCTGQCTVHCPVRLVVGLTLLATVGVQTFYTGHSRCHTEQSDGFSSPVPLGTSRWATIHGAPDSPACGTGQSGAPDQIVRMQHFFRFLDFT
jgi:hypothetical protein